jgi:hypothetical protein
MRDRESNNHLAEAYHRMLERAVTALHKAKGALSLSHLIESAKHTAVDLKEITSEEAERIGEYVKRDVRDAAAHARESRRELATWLRFDIGLVEDRVLEFLQPLVDHTRLELDRLAMEAEVVGWHTGEVAAPGVLTCDACGQELHMHGVGHIPPCPKCKATVFHRKRG